MAKRNREQEIISCCEGIIRNASKIADDWGYNQNCKIIIQIDCNKAPTVEITKSIIPVELTELMIGGG